VAARVEQGVELVGVDRLLEPVLRGTSNRIDDLVLQYPGEPGTQVRAPGVAALGRERGEERFLDGVFRLRLVP